MKNIIDKECTKEVQAEKEEIINWAEGLEKMAHRIKDHFTSPTFKRAVQYLKGLLSKVDRKNTWQLAEITGNETPYGLQNMVSQAEWDANAVRDDLQSYVIENIGDEEGIFILDETGFLKKGKMSVGVQRQYSGTAGRIENCQIGVFLAYTTSKGHTLIDRELYLPESWTSDKERCRKAGVPENVVFQTKPQLGRKMLEKAFVNKVPGKWVTGDEVYGDNGLLRSWLESVHRPYVLAVSCKSYVCKGFEQLRVDALLKTLSQKSWKRLSAGEGSKGHRWYDWAMVLINNVDELGWKRWVLFRRRIEDPSDIAYYLVFAPQDTSLEETVHVAGSRWTIEICFESAKNEVGLDQYEVRIWQGWYRHMTLAMFAHAFLTFICSHANTQEAKKGGTIIRIPKNNMKEFKSRRGILSR